MKFLSRLGFLNQKKREERLFADISDEIKWTLQRALQSEIPVHILLVGRPGLGITRFLKAIEKEYPDLSYFALASGSTGVEVWSYSGVIRLGNIICITFHARRVV